MVFQGKISREYITLSDSSSLDLKILVYPVFLLINYTWSFMQIYVMIFQKEIFLLQTSVFVWCYILQYMCIMLIAV